jgi:hypothetical protein
VCKLKFRTREDTQGLTSNGNIEESRQKHNKIRNKKEPVE